MSTEQSDRAKRIKKTLSKRKELSRTLELGRAGGSFVVTSPELIHAAAQSLSNIGGTISEQNAAAPPPPGTVGPA